MGQHITIVGQYAEDQYYGSFKSNSDFFTSEDFIYHVGTTFADIMRQEYTRQYDELRSEKKDAMVEFDPSWLNEQELKVELKDGEYFATLTSPPMTFHHDKQSTGIQSVFSIKPNPGMELERATLNQKWQLEYTPSTNVVFFVPLKKKLLILKNGVGNANMIRVFYVPAIGEDMEIPDGLVDLCITNAVGKMKQLLAGTIQKKSLDGNIVRNLETEIDKTALK
jgi:hypothetical protein